MDTLAEVAAAFGLALRANGLAAPVSSVACFAEALHEVGIVSPTAAYWAGHCSFVRRPEDTPVYAATFAAFYTAALPASVPPARESRRVHGPEVGPGISERSHDGPAGDPPPHLAPYSSVELLRQKDFASCSEDELREIGLLMRSVLRHPSRRRTRRRSTTGSRHGPPNLRKTIHASLRQAGEPATLYRFGRRYKERTLVLLVDVSGSMDAYSRTFLRFAQAIVTARRGVEVFALGTRLTRITRALSWKHPEVALGLAGRSVHDMSGGTRLGEVIALFNHRFGVPGVARGAVVVIFSDGWDQGEPDRIDREMARLALVAHRIIWVNPLKAAPGYVPLARGMAAALPYVDTFLSGSSLASLELLADALDW